MKKLRQRFIEDLFAAGFFGFLIGGASLDSTPMAGGILCAVSAAIMGLIAHQNAGSLHFMKD